MKYKILLMNYFTDEHKESVNYFLDMFPEIKVQNRSSSDSFDVIEIECKSNEAVKLVEDMNCSDYFVATR